MQSLEVRPWNNYLPINLIWPLWVRTVFDTKHGAMTPDHEEAAIKGLAVKQSQNAYVLADSSKLGQMSFVKFANSEEVELITENN